MHRKILSSVIRTPSHGIKAPYAIDITQEIDKEDLFHAVNRAADNVFTEFVGNVSKLWRSKTRHGLRQTRLQCTKDGAVLSLRLGIEILQRLRRISRGKSGGEATPRGSEGLINLCGIPNHISYGLIVCRSRAVSNNETGLEGSRSRKSTRYHGIRTEIDKKPRSGEIRSDRLNRASSPVTDRKGDCKRCHPLRRACHDLNQCRSAACDRDRLRRGLLVGCRSRNREVIGAGLQRDTRSDKSIASYRRYDAIDGNAGVANADTQRRQAEMQRRGRYVARGIGGGQNESIQPGLKRDREVKVCSGLARTYTGEHHHGCRIIDRSLNYGIGGCEVAAFGRRNGQEFRRNGVDGEDIGQRFRLMAEAVLDLRVERVVSLRQPAGGSKAPLPGVTVKNEKRTDRLVVEERAQAVGGEVAWC